MKKIGLLTITAILLITLILYGKQRRLSDIPLPTVTLIGLDYFDDSYDTIHLKKLLVNGEIFSFLELYEHFDLNIDDEIDKSYYSFKSFFRLNDQYNAMVRIAILLPKREIGSYSKSIPSSVLNYLMFNDMPFEMKVFDFKEQKALNLENVLQTVKEEDFKALLLVLTDNKMDILRDIYIPNDINIFIPTVNKYDLRLNMILPDNIYFGGISYKKQIDTLMAITRKNIVMYSDKSRVSENMTNYLGNKFYNRVIDKKKISNKKFYYRDIVDIPALNAHATVFLNTPIVTSSILLSNFTYYDKRIDKVLSTQINYKPAIFNLTQPQDRDNLYIANSIITKNSWVEDYNRLVGNNVVYDWVNYASVLGTDFLVNKLDYYTTHYDIPMINNQFIYSIEILKPANNRFEKIRE